MPNNALVGTGRASPPDLTLPEEGSGDEDDLPLGVVLYRRRESHAQRKQQSDETQKLAHKLREEARQKEAKAKQEELQKKKFAEQVAAARERREQIRTGKPAKDPWLAGADSSVAPTVKTRKPAESSPTRTKDGTSRRQTLPSNSPLPWTERPPSMAMPLTAPLTVQYPCGPIPFVDPLQIAMFEQGMRVWAYNESGNGSLTRPRFPSSGGSTGSLTPPRFPNSRPSSFASSMEELDTRLSHSRSCISPLKDGSLRSSRDVSPSRQSQSRTRPDGEGRRSPRSSNTLPRSMSTRADLSSGNKTVGRAGHGYAPSASSRLAQPPSTLPSNQSTEVVSHPSRPHAKSMPDRPTRSGQRHTEGSRTKRENDFPALALASLSKPKEDKRTLTSYGSVWSIRDNLHSRTVVS